MAHSPIQSLSPQLFEKVLLQLPMLDLLFAQSVCKNWQAAIKGSPMMQKALFFKAEPGSLTARHPEDSIKNPLLYNRFRGWKILDTNDYGLPIASFIKSSSSPVFGDPGHILDPNSSWRKMFLSQPPFEDLRLLSAHHFESSENYSDEDDVTRPGFDFFHYHCDGGITMGALMQELERIYNSMPSNHWWEVYQDTKWLLNYHNDN